MVEALDSYVIEGLRHNVPLLYDIVDSQEFRSGALTTNFIKDKYPDGFQPNLSEQASQQLATVAALLHQVNRERKAAFEQDSGRLGGFKLSSEFSVSIESGEVQH